MWHPNHPLNNVARNGVYSASEGALPIKVRQIIMLKRLKHQVCGFPGLPSDFFATSVLLSCITGFVAFE
jgi:hypothetical protein